MSGPMTTGHAKSNLNAGEIAGRIDELRGRLGSRVTILGHHYQDESVIRHVDVRGDSLELARMVPDITTEHIVFCGVYFMAESAALLARPEQLVHLPEPSANCVMAQTAPPALVEGIITRLTQRRRPYRIVPLAYVNSSVAVKAVVGRFGGAVCTSANAERMLAWALDQAGEGGAVLFLPDKNLGANTAHTLGLPPEAVAQISLRGEGKEEEQGRHDAESDGKRLLLWPGSCAIHARFNVRQILSRRAEYPGLRVVVHPECSPAVVAAADAAGSTSFIGRYVASAPYGSAIAIGTEINMVERLRDAAIRTHTVIPLLESECSHMDRTKPSCLLETLEAIAAGTEHDPFNRARVVRLEERIVRDAKATLDTMLEVCR